MAGAPLVFFFEDDMPCISVKDYLYVLWFQEVKFPQGREKCSTDALRPSHKEKLQKILLFIPKLSVGVHRKMLQ
jgi:hypothetical protein